MVSFKEYYYLTTLIESAQSVESFDFNNSNSIQNKQIVLEHYIYKNIPKTNNSYREDVPKSSTNTQIHSHVYVNPNGEGKQLYSVNFDGSGHDGSSGIKISKKHAEFFRQKGYDIKDGFVLESILPDYLNNLDFHLFILNE